MAAVLEEVKFRNPEVEVVRIERSIHYRAHYVVDLKEVKTGSETTLSLTERLLVLPREKWDGFHSFFPRNHTIFGDDPMWQICDNYAGGHKVRFRFHEKFVDYGLAEKFANILQSIFNGN